MKRNLFIINIICVLFAFIHFNNVKILATDDNVYETSDGTKFYLDDVVIYDTDLIGKNFETELEFIDYIYEVGYNRIIVCDEKYDIDGHKVTKAELELALDPRYTKYVSTGLENAQLAVETTQKVFGYTNDDTIANAFQHAYWVMLMYFHTSPDYAIKEAHAHEMYDGNDPLSKDMDLYNDDMAHYRATTINYTNDEDLIDFAKEMVDDGKLIYIKRNYRYVKEKIYHMSTSKIEIIYDTSDFYCYTNSNVPFGVPETKITRIKYEIVEGSLMEV